MLPLRLDFHESSFLQSGQVLDFALIASNTAHHRLAAIVRGIGIPVLSILDATGKECARIGASRVLILGTDLTMRSPVFRRALAVYGVDADGPHDDAARASLASLIAELQGGEGEVAAERIGRIARAEVARRFSSRPVVPLAFPDQKTLTSFACDDVTYVNTSAAHITAAFELAVPDAVEGVGSGAGV